MSAAVEPINNTPLVRMSEGGLRRTEIRAGGRVYHFLELTALELGECSDFKCNARRRGWLICAYSLCEPNGERLFPSLQGAAEWLDKQPGWMVSRVLSVGGELVNDPDFDPET